MGAPLTIVDNNLHEVSVEGRAYIFHIPTTSLFERDSLTGDILQALRDDARHSRASLTQALTDRYTQRDIERALGELQSLALIANNGERAPAEAGLELKSFPLTSVVLNVNTGCNLSCTYCYKEDLEKPGAGKKMSFETARDAMEMLLKESPDQPRYNVVFFGGEPLSNLPLIKQVVTYAEQRFAGLGRTVDFSLTTNATLLNEKTVDYLNDHNIGIAVSIDGPPAYHDRNRITVGGRGTYDLVAEKVKLLKARYSARPVGARVTLTRGITDIEAIWDHLFNTLGFHEVGFAPVTAGDVASYNLSGDELATVFANMKRLGEKYLEAALDNRSIGFSNMHQLLTDIHEGTRKVLPCGAGVGMVAVDHAGGIDLCHRFSGSDMPHFGEVNKGLDKTGLNQFLNQRLEQRNLGCNSCQIRNLCAGGCYHESYARYNDPLKPTWHYCELLRDWVDFGIYTYTQILAKNPGFFARYLSPRRAHYETSQSA
jgi:uncharacterized protein